MKFFSVLFYLQRSESPEKKKDKKKTATRKSSSDQVEIFLKLTPFTLAGFDLTPQANTLFNISYENPRFFKTKNYVLTKIYPIIVNAYISNIY
jgi:hypothetical protein